MGVGPRGARGAHFAEDERFGAEMTDASEHATGEWLSGEPPDPEQEDEPAGGRTTMPPVPHALAWSPSDASPQDAAPRAVGPPTTVERELRALLRSARVVSGTLDRDEIVSRLMDSALALVGADQGSIMLFDRYEQSLWIAAAEGLPDEVMRSTVVSLGEGVAGWVAQTGKGQIIEDQEGQGRARGKEARSALCVPMVLDDDERLMGVMNASRSRAAGPFDQADMDRLAVLAEYGAQALRNADELDESRRLFLDTLRALVVALETKDPYARGHTEHVTRYAVLLAREVGLAEDQVRKIELAALLHDIGRPSAGEAMLVSGRPLTAVEQTLIRMHPTVAVHVLKEAPDLADVVPMIFHHHERFDGTGYLEGLTGEDIPLGARILAVADAFEAITAHRPHRPARSPKEALAELRAGAGTQFDPRLVEAFAKLVEREPRVAGRGEAGGPEG